MAGHEHGRLVIGLQVNEKYCSVLSLLKDVAHTYWEVIQPAVVDFLDAYVVWLRIATANADGFHGSSANLKNASFVLVNFYRLFWILSRWTLSTSPVKFMKDSWSKSAGVTKTQDVPGRTQVTFTQIQSKAANEAKVERKLKEKATWDADKKSILEYDKKREAKQVDYDYESDEEW